MADRLGFAAHSRMAWLPADQQHLLPDVQRLIIELNGHQLAVITALPDAPSELAIGWLWMHGFLDDDSLIEHVTLQPGRISVMAATSQPLPSRTRQLESAELLTRHWPRVAGPPSLAMTEEQLAALVRAFRDAALKDDAVDGYAHAAVATVRGIACLARDVHGVGAVAKVLGWAWSMRADKPVGILLVDAIITDEMIQAAGRLGILLVASTVSVARRAVDTAREYGVSVIAMTGLTTSLMVHNGGHMMTSDAGEGNQPD